MQKIFIIFLRLILSMLLLSDPSIGTPSLTAAIGPAYQTEKQIPKQQPTAGKAVESFASKSSAAGNSNGGQPNIVEPSAAVGGSSQSISNSEATSAPSATADGATSTAAASAEINSTMETAITRTTDASDTDCSGPRRCDQLAGRRDFDQGLAAAGAGDSAGIKARLNPQAFQALSQELVGILNYQIQRVQLPEISQCLPQVSGCLRVLNTRVTNYKCTRNVNLRPAPPNLLVMDVDGVDVSVSGNLGGQLTILVPLVLYGQVQLQAQRVHARVGVIITTNGDSPVLRMATCSATVGRVQLNIQNGGLLGDIARQQLHAKLTRIVRQQISSQLCRRVPQLIDQQINSKISDTIPKKIELNSLLSAAMESSCLSALTGGGDEEAAATATDEGTTTIAAIFLAKRQRRELACRGRKRQTSPAFVPRSSGVKASSKKWRRQSGGNGTTAADDGWITADPEPITVAAEAEGEATTEAAAIGGDDAGTAADGTESAGGGGGMSLGPILLSIFDITKLGNQQLNLGIRNTFSSPGGGYTLGIDGGFSLCSWGCTPFRPFPTQIPPCRSGQCKMADAVISDYTINSLLYHLYRVGFFDVTVGPDTTDIGKLMVLNCADSQTDSGDSSGSFFLEDHGVELEDGTIEGGNNGTNSSSSNDTRGNATARADAARRLEATPNATKSGNFTTIRRKSRQLDATDVSGGGFSLQNIIDLGVCIGTLLPAAKEKNEEADGHEKVDIKVRPSKAPAVFIHQNGSITATFEADIDFLAHSTGALFTTWHLDSEVLLNVNISEDQRITGSMEVLRVDVRDAGGKSGLDQDQLDTYIGLIQTVLVQAVNGMLEKGCKLEAPTGPIAGLPLEISDLRIGFVEHGLHAQFDFKLSLADSGIGSEPCMAAAAAKAKAKRRRV